MPPLRRGKTSCFQRRRLDGRKGVKTGRGNAMLYRFFALPLPFLTPSPSFPNDRKIGSVATVCSSYRESSFFGPATAGCRAQGCARGAGNRSFPAPHRGARGVSPPQTRVTRTAPRHIKKTSIIPPCASQNSKSPASNPSLTSPTSAFPQTSLRWSAPTVAASPTS